MRALLALGVCGALLAPAALAVEGMKPGAYCPLPKPGVKPACLDPARHEYSEFFGALDDGDVGDAAARRLEGDVAAGAGSRNAYLALSSLAYGYYLLALRAAAQPGAEPSLRTRLERWNQLLASAYASSPEDPPYREALREALRDVHQRAPAVGLRCTDEQGRSATCDSTEAVLRGLDRLRDDTGVRGDLGRLLERVVGEDGS